MRNPHQTLRHTRPSINSAHNTTHFCLLAQFPSDSDNACASSGLIKKDWLGARCLNSGTCRMPVLKYSSSGRPMNILKGSSAVGSAAFSIKAGQSQDLLESWNIILTALQNQSLDISAPLGTRPDHDKD